MRCPDTADWTKRQTGSMASSTRWADAPGTLAAVGASVALGLFYAAFQLHWLPVPLARIAGRLYFYPTLPLTYIARRKNYYTLVDSHVFLGAVPIAALGHVDQLHARGVRAVVNLCDEYAGPVEAYRKRGIQQLWLPTVDHTEPSLEDIRKAIDFISFHKDRGSRVYVHCKAGAGRSATIAFCWLLHAKETWNLSETQLYLSDRRKVRKTLGRQPNAIAYFASLHPPPSPPLFPATPSTTQQQ
ncbi:hypothetical protein SPRG_06106 [Saprolegnia parasitica CBS 223.65]|uniref:Uncharacterized protein n=1 Tax=Saprolegnia parasitica (strain CBS 223.65) TaxID=695850 RepID=A0A067CR82_SAPPC|nr:hypothetical protein SPRG_06106 [Saprolegnia parasitica CBS 223.65]KDO29051.1 hypothetical protein SPRG_06106 [Saprolegnia parasitica CBS 223.65]|eukprot:XP_012200221.1 hypothetical protein SPRG_06106 [Saprolegnia parasitica CBS 223.65]